MLNYTDVDVIVYQGQLDLICDTKGLYVSGIVTKLSRFAMENNQTYDIDEPNRSFQ